jgi:DNA repair exonuclease SbcCD nuclease subunit
MINRVLVYSDIHYHAYSNGITLSDVVAVEDKIYDIATEWHATHILNLGDWFLSRNPTVEVRIAAERQLLKLCQLNVPIIRLVGNHDRITKSQYATHNLAPVALYYKHLDNVFVLDNVGVFKIDGMDIHHIPAGHHAPKTMQFDGPNNIAVFHDIIRGCKYHTGAIAMEGIQSDAFDYKELLYVLGGDNHQHQFLNLRNTTGEYVGAPLQHNWGDVNSVRGCILLTVDTDKHTATTAFMPIDGPKFIKAAVSVADIADLANIDTTHWRSNILRLSLSGSKDTLSRVHVDTLEDKLVSSSGARSIKISIKYTDSRVATMDAPVIMSDNNTWNRFVDDVTLPENVDRFSIRTLGEAVLASVKT